MCCLASLLFNLVVAPLKFGHQLVKLLLLVGFQHGVDFGFAFLQQLFEIGGLLVIQLGPPGFLLVDDLLDLGLLVGIQFQLFDQVPNRFAGTVSALPIVMLPRAAEAMPGGAGSPLVLESAVTSGRTLQAGDSAMLRVKFTRSFFVAVRAHYQRGNQD